MSYAAIRIFPLGDTALTVEFGTGVSEAINRKAIGLAQYFERNRFPGLIEAVPAYSSTTLFYDPGELRKHFPQHPTAFAAVKSLAIAAINVPDESSLADHRTVDIAVTFDNDDASPDLAHVAERSGLSTEQVIQIFTTTTYRVFMLGFLPGFSYLGEVDERIATPRKETPRLLVPKGSVGIAGRQAGIYSLDSPGGWQIIGRTDIELFTPGVAPPSFLLPGDRVRFLAAR